ncbi:hypothetical protein AB4Y72_12150 [Arthrobacter sp. YAF34]
MNTEGRESFSVAGISVLGILYLLFGYVAWASPSPIRPSMPWAWLLLPAALVILFLTAAQRAARRRAREELRRSRGAVPAWTAYVEPSSASVLYGTTVRGGNVMLPGTITFQDGILTWQFRKTRGSSSLSRPIQWSIDDAADLHEFRSIGRKGMLTLSFSGGAEACISIENAEDFSRVTGIPLGSRA